MDDFVVKFHSVVIAWNKALAHMVIPILVHLLFSYRAVALFCVGFLPVRRPVEMFSLVVSILERPSILVIGSETGFPLERRRLIVPDGTMVAARLGGRVVPLGLVVFLPGLLVGMVRVSANARTQSEL